MDKQDLLNAIIKKWHENDKEEAPLTDVADEISYSRPWTYKFFDELVADGALIKVRRAANYKLNKEKLGLE